MLDVKLKFDNIKILNIEKEDIETLYKCIKSNEFIRNIKYDPLINSKELNNIFYEYYLNECEFFLKILYKDKIIGVLKGRAEFKNPNEIWVMYFLKYKEYENTIIWDKILNKLEIYFFQQYAIDNFYIVIDGKNNRFYSVLKNKGFIPTRSCNILINDRTEDLNIILKKNIKFNRIYR